VGFACVDNDQDCISTDNPRYCGNGLYCDEGSVCTPEGKCTTAAATSDKTADEDRQLTHADCKCISVLPIIPGVKYNVTNSCTSMFVAVLFTGDILHLFPSTNAISSWARLGEIQANASVVAKPPEGWTIVSIGAVALRNKQSAIRCDFVNGALPN
jgi:hypothetical protein